jgi:predicted metal-dependent hydrolase
VFIEVVHDGERIPCEVVRSGRRTLALTVSPEGAVRARAPWRMPLADIARFAQSRAGWVAGKRAEAATREGRFREPLDPAEIERARELFAERYDACWAVFAAPGEVRPALRSREMRSRWGSLALSGRITLNTCLVRASTECLDYVIFHELCHVRERGHGPRFYLELERYVPAWRERRRELRGML